jgi:NAD+ kinase
MAMPNELVLIRHGLSEGNIAVDRSKRGDHSAYEGDFINRHSSLWRLSDEGVEQAKKTGDWIRTHLGFTFDKYYTSDYIRALETAACLDIKDAQWMTEFYLRERNWGDLDRVSVKEREENYSHSMKEREIDPFYWKPPNGESIADLSLRIDRVINTLHRECEGKRVLIVCHGEVMWAFRVRLERMSQERFIKLDSSIDPLHRIHNCQIIQYTRINPHKQSEGPTPYLSWMRSFCPQKGIDSPWEEIIRQRYSNEELLQRAAKVPRIING